MIFNLGYKVKFKSEKQQYTVKAYSSRFVILTKPFNLKKTVLYTIIDLDKKIRGTDNKIFCGGYATQEDIDNNLFKLMSGETEVSSRNNIPLDIEIINGKSVEVNL